MTIYFLTHASIHMKFSSLKFKQLIEEEKKRLHISNNQVIAERMNVSKLTIENIMNGKSKPSIDVLCTIAVSLGKDITVFFEYGDNENYQTKDNDANENIPGARIIDSNKYLVTRFEEVISENANLKNENAFMKKKLEEIDKIQGTSYSMQDVPNTIAAEPTNKLRNK